MKHFPVLDVSEVKVFLHLRTVLLTVVAIGFLERFQKVHKE